MAKNKTLIAAAVILAAYVLYKRETSLQSAVEDLINENPDIF